MAGLAAPAPFPRPASVLLPVYDAWAATASPAEAQRALRALQVARAEQQRGGAKLATIPALLCEVGQAGDAGASGGARRGTLLSLIEDDDPPLDT